MDEVAVVTCFLRHEGAVLLVRRPDDAGTYPGRWGAVTGSVADETPTAAARREVVEETGLDPTIVRAGDPFTVEDAALDHRWRVHPFLVDVDDRELSPSGELADHEWTTPTAILRRDTVPELWASYDAVRPAPASIAADTEHGSAAISLDALEALRDAAGLAAVEGAGLDPVAQTARALLDARPSMAALRNRVDRAMAEADTPAEVEAAAIEGIDRALEADAGAAAVAAERLDGGTVLTLSRSGTVRRAIEAGASAAIVAESRPGREGVGVAEGLAAAGLEVTLCPDAAVGHLLATRPVEAVLVGADAVTADGRVVNKVGTRLAALAAARVGVPVYAVAAADKIRPDETVHLEEGPAEAVYDGGAPIAVANPTFEVTPADLIDGVATERGVLDDAGVAAVAAEHEALGAWRQG